MVTAQVRVIGGIQGTRCITCGGRCNETLVTTETECNTAAEARGYTYTSSGIYGTKGCYAYPHDHATHAGQAYWSTNASGSTPSGSLIRVYNCTPL